MSYLVLARKYRPQTFDQVVEQEHVSRTLSNAISSKRVAHAVLFCGPRGTGKTTVARILAKAMNCKEGPVPKPCNECRSCTEITSGHAVDVFEIDGASNNSVDQVRELRENIKYMPAHSLYKIYIIDEVHMLSMPAFNALLKTLEEPPPHVMFIFATTEPHKIPITILSRCQRHDFKRIGLNAMIQHLLTICAQERFKISDESLALIAREATGSLRDALSLLDQLLGCFKNSVDHNQVLETLGVIDRKYVFDLCGTILRGDIPAILNLLDDSYDRGYDLKKLYTNLLEHFRNLIVVKIGQNISKLVDLPEYELEQMAEQARQVSLGNLNQIFENLYREEVSIRLSTDAKLALEVAFIRMDLVKPALPIDVLIDRLDHLRQEFSSLPQNEISNPKLDRASATHVPEEQTHDKPSEGEAKSAHLNSGAKTIADNVGENLEDIWNQLYGIIARKNPPLGASLSKCRLKQVTAANIEIEVRANGFTLNMLQREKNKAILKKLCSEFFGRDIDIVLTNHPETDDESPKKKSQNDSLLKQKAISHPTVADAIEIFNGKLIDVKIF